jgi:hypothetical protein
VIQAELKRRIRITEDGKRKRITKREAIGKQLVNKAASGDLRAMRVLLNEARAHETAAMLAGPSVEITSQEDQKVMESIMRRIREAAGPLSSATSSEPAGAGRPASNDPDEDNEVPS